MVGLPMTLEVPVRTLELVLVLVLVPSVVSGNIWALRASLRSGSGQEIIMSSCTIVQALPVQSGERPEEPSVDCDAVDNDALSKVDLGGNKERVPSVNVEKGSERIGPSEHNTGPVRLPGRLQWPHARGAHLRTAERRIWGHRRKSVESRG